MTNKMWPRRSLMSGMSAVAAAFALGARPASAQTAAAPFQPARHPQDEWLDKIRGQHRVVFDVTSFRGVPEALHFAHNTLTGNKSMYGLDEADIAIVIVLRHSATAFGYSDAMWAKHGKALTAATSYTDPKSSELPKGNPYNATGIEAIDQMAKRGVQFGVCDTASHGLSRRIAGQGGDADAAYKEMVASMIPNSRLMVAGVIGVTRAQEYGYSVVHAG
jgi:intracellular sulfur oxidation DsrE/DsrF family protein